MKSRDKSNKKPASILEASDSTRRNGKLMLLLQMVPEFQNDIRKLRDDFGIPIGAYLPDYIENDDEKKAEDQADNEAFEKMLTLGVFFSLPIGFNDETKVKPYQIRIIEIGEKFHLPYNLYNDSSYGISWYALRNYIRVLEKNWEIHTDIKILERKIPVRWAVIKAYLPLDSDEANEAITTLNKILKSKLPKNLLKNWKIEDDTEMQLARVAKIIDKNKYKKEQGRKIYKKGGYLDQVRKIKPTLKKMREYEKLHGSEINILPAMTVSERGLKKDFNDLAITLFGYGLF